MSTSSNNPNYGAAQRSTTSVSTVILTLAGSVIVLAAIKSTASIIAPVLLAFFLMMIFRPLMAALERRRVPRGVTIPLSIVLVYGVIIFLGACVYLALARFAIIVSENGDKFTELARWVGGVAQQFGVDPTNVQQIFTLISPARLVNLASTVISASASVLTALAFLAALVFFMGLDAADFSSRLAMIVRLRPATARALSNLGVSTRSYFAVAATFGAIVAVLDWILLAVLGVPYAWLWALLAFVTNFIPNIGFVLGLIPPALVAWLVIDWQTAVIIAVGYSVLNVVVQTLIQPKVVGDRVQLNTTLTFLALIIWTFLLGGLGAILAIPMTLLIRALFVDSQPQHRWVRALFSSGPPPGTARRKKKAAPAIAHEPPTSDEAPSSVAP
ncbi:MAG TPA: AI-2E family transporter [Microlunatus sp.]|jgi:AI-2 transport protein TqsA|nr:AI-2E family transporter [Microlunatus sp.]